MIWNCFVLDVIEGLYEGHAYRKVCLVLKNDSTGSYELLVTKVSIVVDDDVGLFERAKKCIGCKAIASVAYSRGKFILTDINKEGGFEHEKKA